MKKTDKSEKPRGAKVSMRLRSPDGATTVGSFVVNEETGFVLYMISIGAAIPKRLGKRAKPIDRMLFKLGEVYTLARETLQDEAS